jgi:hypothetical protein
MAAGRLEGMATPTQTERELITQTVLDYYEGWYDADIARMDRALHPDLVKRSSAREQGAVLSYITKKQMIDMTAHGEGKADSSDRRLDIEIEDVSENIATVTVTTSVYHEYLHLVRTPDGWKIANALFRSV